MFPVDAWESKTAAKNGTSTANGQVAVRLRLHASRRLRLNREDVQVTTPGSGSHEDASWATPRVAAGFIGSASEAGRTLQSSGLARLAAHAFTTRDLTFRHDRAEDDRRRLAMTLGVSADRLLSVKQVHGRAVRLVTNASKMAAERPEADEAADAIVSTDPGCAIAVHVADCVPILMADRRGRLVAAVHAGWRGTCAGVTTAVLEAIRELGVSPADLVVAFGPSIGPCCYQVDGRVRTAFLGMTPDAVAWFTEDGLERWKLDLWLANIDQLEAGGVPASAIHACRICTADHLDMCFSYRREGAESGRLAAAIRLGGSQTQERGAAGAERAT
jgi:YfiH family protein